MKTTKEEIVAICDKLNFTYINHSNKSTINGNKKQQIYVRFICNTHQKYGIQEKSLYDLKRLKKPCPYCSHKMLKITFREEMAEINPDIEILSEYVNWDTKIKCRCKIDNITSNNCFIHWVLCRIPTQIIQVLSVIKFTSRIHSS